MIAVLKFNKNENYTKILRIPRYIFILVPTIVNPSSKNFVEKPPPPPLTLEHAPYFSVDHWGRNREVDPDSNIWVGNGSSFRKKKFRFGPDFSVMCKISPVGFVSNTYIQYQSKKHFCFNIY